MPMMQNGYKYDEGIHAESGSGIKLKASEPLSPNAFVQIPADAQPSQNTICTPVSRQKKMRVPRGGSVERPQRSPRRAVRSVQFEEPEPDPVAPSLHIFLEPMPEEEPAPEEDEPASLAQFVASFPKIPDGLIFQKGAASDDGEADEDARGTRNGRGDRAPSRRDERAREDDEALTMRLDEGEYPEDVHEAFYDDSYGWADADEDVRHGSFRSRPTRYDRVIPDVNPRFEKMIREAGARSGSAAVAGQAPRMARGARGAQPSSLSSMRTQAISGPLAPNRSQAAKGGAASRVSGPLPMRNGGAIHDGRAANGLGSQRAQINGPASLRMAKQGSPMPSATAGGSSKGWGAPLSDAARPNGIASTGGAPVGQPPFGMRSAASLGSTVPVPTSVAPHPAAGAPAPGMGHPGAAKSGDGNASVLGKPLLDASAIEESTIFDEPPISIAEGMKDAEKSHMKGRKLIIIVLLAVIAVLVGAFVFLGSQGDITIPEISITTTNPNATGTGSGSSSSDSNGPTQEAVGGDDGSSGSGAGSVTYRYTAKTPAGVEYSVEESTTFDAQGKCTFTTMKMQFPSESAAKEYTDSLARDLGTKYTLDSLNGANATVTVDNSGLGLNREDYENALRYSVDDLVILKK